MSPKGFLSCVKRGGRVRTIKPKPGRYIHICYIGGKSYAGERSIKLRGGRDENSCKV